MNDNPSLNIQLFDDISNASGEWYLTRRKLALDIALLNSSQFTIYSITDFMAYTSIFNKTGFQYTAQFRILCVRSFMSI